MKTAILCYLFIGIILTLVGPLAKKMKEQIFKVIKPSLADIVSQREPIPLWKKIAVTALMLILNIVFYPILYLVISYDYYRAKSFKKKSLPTDTDNYLYHRQMGGAGRIQCKECNFKEDIISFIHGMEESAITGYQCQACGKFKGIEQNKMNEILNKQCDCGGDLERTEPLFCPKCKTHNISYHMSYIT